IFFLAMLLVSILYLLKIQSELTESQRNRYESFKIADELRQSSDDLTRFARTFAVTGNPFYEKAYWDIIYIRDGKIDIPENYHGVFWDLILDMSEYPKSSGIKQSILSRMEGLGFTEEEFNELELAKSNSDGLVATEEIAMNAIRGIYKNKDGDFIVKGKPDRDMAIRILHDREYHEYKKIIMEPIDRFTKSVESRNKKIVDNLEFKLTVILSIILILIACLSVSFVLSILIIQKRILSPILELTTHERNVESDSSEYLLNITSNDEIGQLARELRESKLRIKATQAQLIQSEKMSTLGTLVAGIAHEINTPLGAIRGSAENLFDESEKVLVLASNYLQSLDAESKKLFTDLINSQEENQELNSREKRVYRQELKNLNVFDDSSNRDDTIDKFADMGKSKNPDLWIQFFANNNSKDAVEIAYRLVRQKKNIKNILLSVDRSSKMLMALKKYSHSDSMEKRISLSLSESIETVLTIYNNIIKTKIEVIKDFKEDFNIIGYPDELAQVWTNLIYNAIQAIDSSGTLEISISNQILDHKNFALVSIKDSGRGIAAEHQDKIFQPFFTTKARGEGTGLGLDIVKRIIDKHNGNIYFETKLGEGTTFFVALPME
ncbi:MAG: GHKL domain-containing protein, partial [Leptospira sp.]|nr:GHKL domain-containing protein [Leptospira sp.]